MFSELLSHNPDVQRLSFYAAMFDGATSKIQKLNLEKDGHMVYGAVTGSLLSCFKVQITETF